MQFWMKEGNIQIVLIRKCAKFLNMDSKQN